MREPILCPRCDSGLVFASDETCPHLVWCDFCDSEAGRIIHGLDDANRAGFDSLSLYHEARNDTNQERMP